MKICVVVPHFDHVEEFRALLPGLAATGHHLVVVDDASPAESFSQLAQLIDTSGGGCTLIRHAQNLGKGGAVASGLRAAGEAGFTHAVQIDADGQHDYRDIAVLCAAAAEHPHSLVCGEPVFDQSISPLRYYARHLTLYLVWLETLSKVIRDPMCGLRVYPLPAIIELLDRNSLPTRMGFDPEILVRAIWTGIPLEFVKVHVRYLEGGKSHFRYFTDNLEISSMHARLLGGMLVRIPQLLRPAGGGRSRLGPP